MNSVLPFVEPLVRVSLLPPADGSFGPFVLPLAMNPSDNSSFGLGSIVPLITSFLPILLNIVGAALILALGWIVAKWVAAIIRKLLQKTTIDDRLSAFLSGGNSNQFSVETILALLVEWLIKILAIVAALNVLNLTVVSQPLTNLISQILGFLPRIGSAVALLGVAWLLATIVKNVAVQAAESFDIDSRLNSASADSAISPTDTLATALYWFVFLFFLPVILGVLGLEGPLAPVQALLTQLLSAIPQILKAVAIGVVGWFIANIVRNVVANLLAATGVDNVGRQVGISQAKTGQSLSSLGGLVTYVFILIPAIIAALKELGISAISDPATNMLNQFMSAIPLIFTAGVILGISYFVGKILADLTSSLLSGFGFDALLGKMGLQTQPPADGTVATTPSQIAGTVVLVATMLVATVTAADVLKITALTNITSGLLGIAGQVLVGVLVFGAGLFIANWVADFIKSTGMRESNLLATAARVAILIFSGAMALRQVGVATDIVNLTFGLLLGALAVALAIAFGLGGRDVAAEQLRDWVKPFK
jgi:Conserved TM helix